jgi:hypothetical protein
MSNEREDLAGAFGAILIAIYIAKAQRTQRAQREEKGFCKHDKHDISSYAF